jgi:pSer/pThr/pTyr-binding forkhead associated (FHA) protein
VRATEDKSYEAVVKLDASYNSDGSIFAGKRSSNNNFDITSGRVLRGSEDDNFVTSSPEVLQKQRYYHVGYTFSFDGNSTSTQKLYINGVLVSQRIETSYVDGYINNQNYIGYDDRFSQYFKGEIPSFKIYKKELKEKDIQQSFQNHKRNYNF